MSPSVQNFGGTGKQVQCSVLSCSQHIFTANTTLSEGTGSAPAPSPAAPITGRRRTATSPCARTEKGATQHSQNYKTFTWSHEFWHRAGDWAPCATCNVSLQGEGERCQEHEEAVMCLANAKCTISFNGRKPLILWFFQHRWKYLKWFGCFKYFLLK